MTGTSAERMWRASVKLRLRGVQESMDCVNDNRSFSDARSDAFNRSGADVADGKDAGFAGRKRRGEPSSVPGLPGHHKTLGVEIEATVEPFGIGLRPDHDENVADRTGLSCAVVTIAPRHFTQPR